MHLTLLESDRSVPRSTECASLSLLAHAALACLALGITAGGRQLPTDEREARAFFTLPPDRADAPLRQDEILRWSPPGGALNEGDWTTGADAGGRSGPLGPTGPRAGERSHAQGAVPFGPPARLADSAFTMFEVDRMVERSEGSEGPVYPPELAAAGIEGTVHATYVVDTTGHADSATIRILGSDHPRFTESVRTALRGMWFRPAKRHGRTVRQLVEQRFRFQVGQTQQMATHTS